MNRKIQSSFAVDFITASIINIFKMEIFFHIELDCGSTIVFASFLCKKICMNRLLSELYNN